MAANERVVNLAIRAKDEYSKVLKGLEEAGRKVQLQFATKTRKAFADNQAEIRMLSQEIERLNKASKGSGEYDRAIKQRLKEKQDLIAKQKVLAQQLQFIDSKLKGSSTPGSFNNLTQAANSAEIAQNKVARLRKELQQYQAEAKKGFLNQSAANSVGPGFGSSNARITNEARENARQLKDELRQLAVEQHRASGAAQHGFAAFSRAADALKATDIATDSLTASTEAEVPALNKKTAATKAATAAERGHAEAIKQTETASRLRRMSGSLDPVPGVRSRNKGKKGDAQEVEVWGLKPWQLTNLGYQANDVISGLAMGQAPLQIFAQQAGQIAQIWPDVMVSVARSIPQFAALTAVLAPLITAMKRASDEADALRSFTSQLAVSADGARYSAKGLVEAARGMKEFGVSFKDAREIISGFIKEGLSADQIEPLARMAKQLAEVTGTTIPEAAQKLAGAFSGGASGIRELDRELNFLTADQYEHVRSLIAAGDKTQALAFAQDVLRGNLERSKQPLGDLDAAFKRLRESWDRIVEAFSDSWLMKDLQNGIDRIVLAVELFSQVAAFVSKIGDEGTKAEQMASLKAKRADLVAKLAEYDGNRSDPWYNMQAAALEEQLAQVDAAYNALVDEAKAAADATGQIADAAGQTAAAAGEAADATEDQKKAAIDVNDVVQQQVSGLRQQYESTLLTSKEQFVQNALLEARNAAMARANELGVEFLGLTQQQTTAIRDQAGLLYDRQQSVDLQGNLSSFVDKTVGVESGGNPNAKNPNSTATGLGQFIESTWLAMFKKYFPDRAAGMTNAAILALRKDAALSRKMVELYAQENAKVLQGAGAAVTEASLYLAHFLGPRGAAGVMVAAASTPVSQILDADQINANKSILAGKTAGEVRAWSERKMGVSEVEVDAAARLNEIEGERLEKADEYNKGYKERLADQQFENELFGKSARDAAIAKAIREEELEAQKAGLELTRQQREEVARVTGELFDKQNAEANVNRLMEQRELILERMSIAQDNNDSGAFEAAKEELRSIDDALTAAIDKAILFWQAIGGEQADLAVEKLELMKLKLGESTDELATRFIPTAEQLNDQLAETGSSAVNQLAQQAAQGELSFESFFGAIRQGLGQFLIQIGQAIVKQAIFNALSGGTAGGGAGNFLSQAIMAAVRHDGGMAGGSGQRRLVDPAVFTNATRYHSGGLAGLRPNEVPIIAERQEEILTEDDPRHRKNFRGANPQVKVVNVLDPADIIEKALGTEIGEKAIINFMARRSRQIKGVLG